MTENPDTLGQQILNLAEGVGVQMKALKERIEAGIDTNITASDIYDSNSSNAMSGKAVASALNTITAQNLTMIETDPYTLFYNTYKSE